MNNINLAKIYKTDDRVKATYFYQESINILNEIDARKLSDNPAYSVDVAKAFSLAGLLNISADKDKVNEILNEITGLFESILKDEDYIQINYGLNILRTIGDLALELGSNGDFYDKAKELYIYAIDLVESNRFPKSKIYEAELAYLCKELAKLIYHKEQSVSEYYFDKSIEAMRVLGDDGGVLILSDFAKILMEKAIFSSENIYGDIEESKKNNLLYEESIAIYRKIESDAEFKSHSDLATVLGFYGKKKFEIGDMDMAKKLLFEAVDILSPYAKDKPYLYGDKYSLFLWYSTRIDPSWSYICKAMHEINEVAYKLYELKELAINTLVSCK